MPLCVQALVFGLLSALSLPIGALCGIFFSPVNARVTAYFMAFGGGALVFAVATELFGDKLSRLEFSSDRHEHWVGCHALCKQHFMNLMVQTGAGALGAVMYLLLNRWLTKLQNEGERSRQLSTVRVESELMEPCRPLSSEELSGPAGRSFPENQSLRIESSGTLGPQTTAGHISGTGSRVESFNVHERRSAASANVALSMWLGLLLDGIPEALMLGFMTNEKAITFEFILAVFVANFPEAFSASSLLRAQKMSINRIFAMWMAVFVLTGLLAMFGSWVMPSNPPFHSVASTIQITGSAAAEGLTSGSMLAMVSTAMLPEAFHGGGDLSGLFFVMGFGTSVFISALGARFGDPHILFFGNQG